ncbi:hypothetical protein RSOL_339120, partial [Rhizoctonia solani AG-3 Rhs1AP]
MAHLIDTSLSKKPQTLEFITAHLPPIEPKGKPRAQDEDKGEDNEEEVEDECNKEEEEERGCKVGGKDGGNGGDGGDGRDGRDGRDYKEVDLEDGWLAGLSTRRMPDKEPGPVDFQSAAVMNTLRISTHT